MPDIPDAPPGWHTAESAALHQARTDGGQRARIAAALWTRDYQPGPEAEIGGYVYDIADRVAGVVEELVEQARREAAEQIAAAIEALCPDTDTDTERAGDHCPYREAADTARQEFARQIGPPLSNVSPAAR